MELDSNSDKNYSSDIIFFLYLRNKCMPLHLLKAFISFSQTHNQPCSLNIYIRTLYSPPTRLDISIFFLTLFCLNPYITSSYPNPHTSIQDPTCAPLLHRGWWLTPLLLLPITVPVSGIHSLVASHPTSRPSLWRPLVRGCESTRQVNCDSHCTRVSVTQKPEK